jgi:hypothetical protein
MDARLSAHFRAKKASSASNDVMVSGELKRVADEALQMLQQLPAGDASLRHIPLDGVCDRMLEVCKQVCMHAKAVKWNVNAANDPLRVLIEFLVRISAVEPLPLAHLQHCAVVCETIVSTIPWRQLQLVDARMKSPMRKLLDQAVAAESSLSSWSLTSTNSICGLFLAVSGSDVFTGGLLSMRQAEKVTAPYSWEGKRLSSIVAEVKPRFDHRTSRTRYNIKSR